MKRTSKYIVLLIGVFISGNLFSQTSDCKKQMFKDFYNLDNIYKAEVSLFKENDYVVIDYKELLRAIQYSKIVVAKFVPRREVVFYKEGDNTTYKAYFSETNKYFMIGSKTFVLSKKKSKEVSKILNL